MTTIAVFVFLITSPARQRRTLHGKLIYIQDDPSPLRRAHTSSAAFLFQVSAFLNVTSSARCFDTASCRRTPSEDSNATDSPRLCRSRLKN